MKEGKKKKKEKVSPKGLKCDQYGYVFSLLVLRRFPASQKKHFAAVLDTVETCKTLHFGLTSLKYALMELVKQL